MKRTIKIALIGNPNSGKSSIFNHLTGLRQKVANFPGVTVDKMQGEIALTDEIDAIIIDFPGTYSLYPTSSDERVVINTFANPQDDNYPDVVVYVADVTSLEKHFLLLTQIKDLGFPMILALNMMDIAQKQGLQCDLKLLQTHLGGMPIVPISGRYGDNLHILKQQIINILNPELPHNQPIDFYQPSKIELNVANALQKEFGYTNTYYAIIVAHHYEWLPFLNIAQKQKVKNICTENSFQDLRFQIDETMHRFDFFVPILRKALSRPIDRAAKTGYTDAIDSVLTNKIWGPIIFLAILALVFQSVFSIAAIPMDWIDTHVSQLNEYIKSCLPDTMLTSLLTDGIIAGLGGIIVFVPQIAILFLLITILEEVGYMARAVFMFDTIMQKFGLNGRSVVSLVSGGACAIPAIMSARTIENWKERLITIMVTPLISCSARIPVFAMLVGFAVPSTKIFGFFDARGFVFTGLYLISILSALISALVFKKILKSKDATSLMIQLPPYRLPLGKNLLLTVWEKIRAFVFEAGKVIIIISMILWALSSFGPGDEMNITKQEATQFAQNQHFNETETADFIAARKIEASYAGHLGKFIEPIIAPLGFDWKIGIAIITSFAAREVFVGTMATIYSIGSAASDDTSIKEKMTKEINPRTGLPVYTIATSCSLLIFYLFAMQCMSTIAVVYRETKSWKWPLIQLTYMTGLAYLGSFLVYQLLK